MASGSGSEPGVESWRQQLGYAGMRRESHVNSALAPGQSCLQEAAEQLSTVGLVGDSVLGDQRGTVRVRRGCDVRSVLGRADQDRQPSVRRPARTERHQPRSATRT